PTPGICICARVTAGIIPHATITHTITAMRLLSLFIGSNPPVPRSFPPGYSHANQAGPETDSRQGMPPGDRAGGRRQILESQSLGRFAVSDTEERSRSR